MKNCVVSSVVALMVSTPAFAQELVYAEGGVGFAFLEESGNEADLRFIGGQAEFVLDQFFFGVELGFENVQFDSDSGDFSTLGGQVGYMPVDGLMFGLSYAKQRQSFSGSFSGESESSRTEYFAQYETAQFGVAVTHETSEFDDFTPPTRTSVQGKANVTPEMALLAGLFWREGSDDYDYDLGVRYEAGPIEAVASYSGQTGDDRGFLSLAGMYDINPQLRVAGEYATATNSDFDTSFLYLEGAYDINNQFSLLAGYQKAFSEFGDDSFYQIGAEYEVAEYTDLLVAYSASLEGDFDYSSVLVALTYEFGETMRLDQRIEEDFSVDSVFDTLFFGFGGPA